MTFTLTREQLYDLVWSEPMQRLAKKIGISDVAIAKHCRKLGVPVPERSYWNKLQVGQPSPKLTLLSVHVMVAAAALLARNAEPATTASDNEKAAISLFITTPPS